MFWQISRAWKLKPVSHEFPEAKIQDSMLDSMLQQAQLTCDHSEVRSLVLRRSEATWLHDAGHRWLDLYRYFRQYVRVLMLKLYEPNFLRFGGMI